MNLLDLLKSMRSEINVGGGLFGGLFNEEEKQQQEQPQSEPGNLSDIITRQLMKSRGNKESREKWNDVIGRFRS